MHAAQSQFGDVVVIPAEVGGGVAATWQGHARVLCRCAAIGLQPYRPGGVREPRSAARRGTTTSRSSYERVRLGSSRRGDSGSTPSIA